VSGGERLFKIGKDIIHPVSKKKIGRKGEWIKVYHPQLTGWVHSKLVWP